MKEIVIVDNGLANLHSVYNAVQTLGVKPKISNLPKEIKKASHIILPGVGSFGQAMLNLEATNCVDTLKEMAISNKPMLGICLGMQLFFEESEESPSIKGLSLLKGKVFRIDHQIQKKIKLPHVTWNKVHLCKEQNIKLMGNRESRSLYYFVHSYAVILADKKINYAETNYQNVKFVSMVQKDNIFGVQFHPEKSGCQGLTLLNNFLSF